MRGPQYGWTLCSIFLGLLLLMGCSKEQTTTIPSESITENITERETEIAPEEVVSEISSETQEAESTLQEERGPSLQVVGTQLCDRDGKPVQLRGLSTHGIGWFPAYVNKDFFRELHTEWNANVVRIAMYTEEYNGYCSGGDQGVLKQLVMDGVEYATEAGLYVIIDWHTLSDANPHKNKEEAKAFFAEMSARYADYDNVIYEVCNEPNGGISWAEVKSYAEELIAVIRANDADAVILVGTPNWCQYVEEAAADPITQYDNLMYTLHFYADTHRDWLRDSLERAHESGLPIFVSEFGICDASGSGAINKEQADTWIALLDKYEVSYVAWNISNKDETSAIFNSSCTKTSGFTQEDLSESGKWVYETLHK